MTIYTYFKPTDFQSAIDRIAHHRGRIAWDICDPNRYEETKEFFDKNRPILFIYKLGTLVCGAYYEDEVLTILDLNGRNVTKQYNKFVLNEIDVYLRQIEMF